MVAELLDDDVVAGVDELDGRRTDKNVSSQSESSEGANILEETFCFQNNQELEKTTNSCEAR